MAPLEVSTSGNEWLSSWRTCGNTLMFGDSDLKSSSTLQPTCQRGSLPACPQLQQALWLWLLLPSTRHHCCCFPGVHSASLLGVCAAGVGAGHCAPRPVPVQLHCSQCPARFGSVPGTETLSAASCGSEQSQGMQTVPSAAMPQLIACESRCRWKSRCLRRGCQRSVFHQESAWP